MLADGPLRALRPRAITTKMSAECCLHGIREPRDVAGRKQQRIFGAEDFRNPVHIGRDDRQAKGGRFHDHAGQRFLEA